MCDEIKKIRKLKSATTFDEQLNKIGFPNNWKEILNTSNNDYKNYT